MNAVLAEAPAAARVSRVVELRQYTLKPGQRDTLIELFEREFVDTQEACGMDLLGTFRDLDAPDRFVWMRGFADMESRARALTDFYGGPDWLAHREAANATKVEWRDVHLLRPVGFLHSPERVRRQDDGSVVIATIYPLRQGGGEAFAGFFERAMVPLLWNANVPVAARFRTETAANSYPRLPVRENDTVFVWLARFPTAARAALALACIDEALDWTPSVAEPLWQQLVQPPQVLRLAPTATSRLRG
jgi:hypothetical protein